MTRRIAMISEHASPLSLLGGVDNGGQNVYVGHVARNLAVKGYLVDVFTRRDSAEAQDVVRWAEGVRVIHVPAGPPRAIPKERLLPYMEEFTSFLLRYCRQERSYSMAHANFFMSGLVAAELKREIGLPFVVTFHALGRIRRLHQGPGDEFPDDRFAIEDRIVAEADRIIAECPQDQEDLIRLYNADPARIAIIPCGFDPGELWPVSKSAARAQLSIGAEERVILQLGRMVRRKGVDNVVRGVARLRDDHGVDARLLIVGGECDDPDADSTPEIARVRGIAKAEGVAPQVRFMGRCRRERLKYYYSAADVFVTTPWYEPFGITPVEAMACGAPVIGSNVGGIKFTVRDAETGYLIPPNDPEALADRIADLYKHPKLMSALSRHAIRRVNDLFTWQKVAAALADLYEEVLTAGLHGRGRSPDQFETLDRGFREALELLHDASRRLRSSIFLVAEALCDCFAEGGKALICGGGAEAQRFAANFIGRLKRSDRPGLPVIPLNSDPAWLAGWSGEPGHDHVFERQVEAFGQAGDVLLGIGDGEPAPNLERAFSMARRLGMRCVAIAGAGGDRLARLSDLAVIVPSSDIQRIQEVQTVIANLLCELVEERFTFRRRLEQSPASPSLVVKLPEPEPEARHRTMTRRKAAC